MCRTLLSGGPWIVPPWPSTFHDDSLHANIAYKDLLIEYWHDVDTNWGKTAHEFYTEDGRFSTSINTRVGRDAIKKFYDGREGRGERVARHLINNHRITIHDRNRVSTVWILSLFA